MPGGRSSRSQYECSFCGKQQHQVTRLIAGPGKVYICDECVHVCKKILDEEDEVITSEFLEEVPTPREINDYLDQYVVGQDQSKRKLAATKPPLSAATNRSRGGEEHSPRRRRPGRRRRATRERCEGGSHFQGRM